MMCLCQDYICQLLHLEFTYYTSAAEEWEFYAGKINGFTGSGVEWLMVQSISDLSDYENFGSEWTTQKI